MKYISLKILYKWMDGQTDDHPPSFKQYVINLWLRSSGWEPDGSQHKHVWHVRNSFSCPGSHPRAADRTVIAPLTFTFSKIIDTVSAGKCPAARHNTWALNPWPRIWVLCRSSCCLPVSWRISMDRLAQNSSFPVLPGRNPWQTTRKLPVLQAMQST